MTLLIFVLFFYAISPVIIQSHINGGNTSYYLHAGAAYCSSTVGGYGIPETTDERKIQLAYTYAPVLWFYKDSLWEEPFTLIEAEYFIDVSCKDAGNYKLTKDGYIGAKTLQSQYSSIENPVYIRITTDKHEGDTYIVIQYWFCYLYNYGGALSLFNVNHEGEWEMVEVILEYDESITDGISYPEPLIIAYSRHSGGEAHRWENEVVEKEENQGYHPVAYIAYGTHAAYFQDLGWNEDLNKGIKIGYADMNFILIDDKEWLQFPGRWGGQENSPLGPLFQESKWVTPLLWAVNYLDTFQFHLKHPAHLLITNEKGQRIGFVGEEFVNEIHDAYAVVTDGHEYYNVPEGVYSVEISVIEEGIDFDVVMNDNGEVTHLSYEDELVTHIEKVYAEIRAGVKEYTLQLDKDGDGRIDLTLTPDSITRFTDRKEHPFLLYASIVVILAFITYGIQRRIVRLIGSKSKLERKQKLERTRSDVAKAILEGVAAVFLILWFTAAVTDLLGEYGYEEQFLQCSVGMYLFSQMIPALKQDYSTGRKVQEFLINVGWPLIGLWVVVTVLRYTGYVGAVEVGIDIDYFLVTGIIFLLMGYTIRSIRYIKEHWNLRFFFVIGGLFVFFWLFTRIFSLFLRYADYILVIGIVAISIGILGRLKGYFTKNRERKP